MDRVTAPSASSAEMARTSSAALNGSNNAGTVSASRHQLHEPNEFVDRSEFMGDGACSEVRFESPTLIGRPDIDTAMLDALRDVMGSDDGAGTPEWARTDRDRIGVAYRSTGQDDSACGASPLVRRSDIDTAMLDALRHAIVSDTWSRDA
jgi:hypothetical protein